MHQSAAHRTALQRSWLFFTVCVWQKKHKVCYCNWLPACPLCVCSENCGEQLTSCWLLTPSFFFLLISLLLLCSHLLFALVVSSALFFSSFSPSSRPLSSLAALCSATCEYGITFQTPTSTVQLTKISLFSALLFCSRSADKKEEKSENDPFFILGKAKAHKELAWIKRVIWLHYYKICIQDFLCKTK